MMKKTLVTTSSGESAAKAAKDILDRGGSAADAVATASMVQIVNGAGTYVSFAGMLVGLCYEAKTGKVYSINSDYGIPHKKEGDLLTRLYQEGQKGAGVLVPGYFAGLREMLARWGKLPFESLMDYPIQRCEETFVPHERLTKRVEKRSKTTPPSVETFKLIDENVVQTYLLKTLKMIREEGINSMYTGVWGEKFVKTVQAAGGVIDMEDMRNFQAQINDPISITYKDFTVYAPPLENAGGLITLLILKMLERANLNELGHYTQNPDAYLQLITGLRIYMPFLQKIMGNINDAGLSKALGGLEISLENTLSPETINLLWDAIQRGVIKTVPLEKPNNTDAVSAVDQDGNLAIVVHSACATTGIDGLVVDGISLPRMAGEFRIHADYSAPKIPGIFSPIMAIGKDKLVAVAAIHASLFEKQSAVLLNALEYGLPLEAANQYPTPLYPDYDAEGKFTEVIFSEQFDPDFLSQLKEKGLRFKDVREGGLAKFVGSENLDAIESPLVGVEINLDTKQAVGVTSPHYDGTVL